jgi:hypothetical protein
MIVCREPDIRHAAYDAIVMSTLQAAKGTGVHDRLQSDHRLDPAGGAQKSPHDTRKLASYDLDQAGIPFLLGTTLRRSAPGGVKSRRTRSGACAPIYPASWCRARRCSSASHQARIVRRRFWPNHARQPRTGSALVH